MNNLPGRMDAKHSQCITKVDCFFPVHFQTGNSSPANWCNASDNCFIPTPNIMSAPIMLTRMEKWDYGAGQRVSCFSFVILRIVAKLAGERKINYLICTTFR